MAKDRQKRLHTGHQTLDNTTYSVVLVPYVALFCLHTPLQGGFEEGDVGDDDHDEWKGTSTVASSSSSSSSIVEGLLSSDSDCVVFISSEENIYHEPDSCFLTAFLFEKCNPMLK